MIRRKDTLGYVDFMRGKYPLSNPAYILNIIEGMTVDEKRRLVKPDFDSMWRSLWGEEIGVQYRSEEKTSREKLASLSRGISVNGKMYDLASIIRSSTTDWRETEWGFPKGRRNYQERDWCAAVREFSEETGYSGERLNLVRNLQPIEEVFTGSNYKSYKHKYYLAFLEGEEPPESQPQKSEVSKMDWVPVEEAADRIRPYSAEKRGVAETVAALLKRYRLCV